RGQIRAGSSLRVLRLPHDVLEAGGQDEIWVVQNGTLASRRVTYALDKDGSLLVRFGLAENERVVLSPKPEFEAGLRVNVEGEGAP
ncbi:MAG TPA: hypothetical protein VGP93_03130, partial [Polyangiaceae bacterium]|nr:hypothetical protein [Polyangiaceae bacterium]